MSRSPTAGARAARRRRRSSRSVAKREVHAEPPRVWVQAARDDLGHRRPRDGEAHGARIAVRPQRDVDRLRLVGIDLRARHDPVADPGDDGVRLDEERRVALQADGEGAAAAVVADVRDVLARPRVPGVEPADERELPQRSVEPVENHLLLRVFCGQTALQLERRVRQGILRADESAVGAAKIASPAVDDDGRLGEPSRDRRTGRVDRADAAVEELVLPDRELVRCPRPDEPHVGRPADSAVDPVAVRVRDSAEEVLRRAIAVLGDDRVLRDGEVDEHEPRQHERIAARYEQERDACDDASCEHDEIDVAQGQPSLDEPSERQEQQRCQIPRSG